MPVTRHPIMPEPQNPGNDPARSARPAPPHIPIDPHTLAILSSSLEVLRSRGDAVAEHFYSALFAAHPVLRSLFPQSMASQSKKLIDSLVLVVENLRSPTKVVVALRELGRRHTAYGAKPEHYPIVCKLLTRAMASAHGLTWTPQLEAEWSQALELVSRIMIDAAASPQPR